MEQKERIAYLDLVKFFGIFLIYVAHFGECSQLLHDFAFAFHVPLFFFVSGCTESLRRTRPGFFTYIKKKAREILIPFFLFVALSAVYQVLFAGDTIPQVKTCLAGALKGCIRNQYYVESLWFLTCLFLTTVFFGLLCLTGKKWIMGLISAGTYLVYCFGLPALGVQSPELPWNVDSMMRYQLYYVIGYLTFPYLHRLVTGKGFGLRLLSAVLFAGSGLFATAVYFGLKPGAFLKRAPFFPGFGQAVTALILIFFFFQLSHGLEGVSFLRKLGSATLYLCGSEYLVKNLVPSAAGMLGLKISLSNSGTVLIYSFFLLAVAFFVLVPIEKSLVAWVQSFFAGPDRVVPAVQRESSATGSRG